MGNALLNSNEKFECGSIVEALPLNIVGNIVDVLFPRENAGGPDSIWFI